MTVSSKFASLKKRVGGNREKTGYEESFGMPVEEKQRITPPSAAQRRILAELEFALQLSKHSGGAFDGDIDAALEYLNARLDAEGAIGQSDCLRAEELLEPLRGPAKEYELILAGHAHIDMNWMWGWHETVSITLATFRTVLRLMEEFPEFCFSQSQASVYRIVEEYAPELMEPIKKRIAEGRWEVTATSWVEPDKNLPDTESLLRHIRSAKTYLRDTWGVDPDSLEIDFSPDAFGHSRHMPEIDRAGGVKYLYHCRGLDEQQSLYRWRAPGGAELLAYHEQYWYNSGITPHIGIGLPGVAARTAGLKTGLIVYGVGDHGGGPTRRDINRAIEMQAWPVFPRIRFGTLREFFRIAESVRDKLPVLDHELNFVLTGCATTQSRIKKYVRRCENTLLDAESLAALAEAKTGRRFDPAMLESARRDLLFCDFHDILTGSCVQDSREHAIGLLQQTLARGQTRLTDAMLAVTDSIDTTGIAFDTDTADSQAQGAGAGFYASGAAYNGPERGNGLVRAYTVFNPTPEEKAEPVEITLWDWQGDLNRLQAADADGNPLELQLLDRSYRQYWDHQYVRALVYMRMSALSYATVVFSEAELDEYPFYYQCALNTRPDENIVLENECIRAEFDRADGRMVSLRDAQTGEEFLAPGKRAGFVLVDTESRTSDAWNIGRYLREHPVTDSVELVRDLNGHLRSGFTVKTRVRDSVLTERIYLDKGARQVTIQTEADWHETAGETVPVLVYELPVAYAPERYLYNVPGGSALREPMELDVQGLSYAAALRPHEKSAAIFTDCKSGFRGRADGTLISTLINSSSSPDPYPERGIHRFTLGVGVVPGCMRRLETNAVSFNHRLVYQSVGCHAGTLSANGSLWSGGVKRAVICSAAVSGDGLLLRIGTPAAKEGTAEFTFDKPVKKAFFVDLLERPADLPAPEVDGCTVRAAVPPYRIVTLKLEFFRP
ncbi:MAG: alpha-mannosidase [Clostridia bacterium]|nr:alpha-mannosidase [Clostridia bacterium]